MRCLRCAIEYGPDEQFCQRCGRALSRPLGEKPAVIESSAASQSEARFFYTTTAPPPLQAGSRGEAEKVTWDIPIVPPTAPSVWGTSAEADDAPNSASEPAADWDSWATGKTEERLPPVSIPRKLPSLPPAKWVEPAGASGTHQTIASPPRPAVQDAVTAVVSPPTPTPSDDFFGDDDDDEGSALVSGGVRRSAATGRRGGGKSSRGGLVKDTAARPTYGTKAEGDKWSKQRSLGLVVLVAIVIIALGGYAFTKQRAYNSDLTNARSLALAGQYTGALSAYDKAIADWPFNEDAKAGANAVRDAAAAVQQQAQAAALLRAQTNATRQAMYQAHMSLILQEIAGR